MKDQIPKLNYLLHFGRGLEPRKQKEIAQRLGIVETTWSTFSGEGSVKGLPPKHDAKLGEIFGFDPLWPEWRVGSFDDFRQRYEANTIGSGRQSEDFAADIRDMLADLRKLPGLDNLIGALGAHAEAAMDAAQVLPDDMDDEDILALCELQHEINSALAGRKFEESDRPVSRALAAFRELISGLRDRLAADQPIDLNDEMRATLQTALAEVEKLLKDPDTDRNALKSLRGLQRIIGHALNAGRITLAFLDRWSRRTETRLAERYRIGARAIMLCIGAAGRAGYRLPDGAVFVDSQDPSMPELVVIPAGQFIMGSPKDELERSDDEGRQREVRVGRFALGRHAVTFAQYDAFCEATEREKPPDEGWEREDHPVIRVGWDDAQAFVRWLNDQMYGNPYRLPSEAEWEYSCRAGSVTPFEPNVAHRHGGQSIEPDEANFDGNATYADGSKGLYRGQTVPVMHGAFRPNRWGLWQMHGNVHEWCEDVYAESYEGAPSDAVAHQPIDDDTSSPRVLRGGSWNNYPRVLRSANRGGSRPDFRGRLIGFRLARTLTS